MPILPEPQPRHVARHRAKSHPVRLLVAGATLGVLAVSVALAAPAFTPGQRDVGAEPVKPGPALVRLTQSPLFHAQQPAARPKSASPALVHRLRVSAPQRPAQTVTLSEPPALSGLVVSTPTPSPTDTLPNLHRVRVPATSTPSPSRTTVVRVPPRRMPSPTPTSQPTTATPSPTASEPRRMPVPTTVPVPTTTAEPSPTTDCPDPEPTHHRRRHPHLLP